MTRVEQLAHEIQKVSPKEFAQLWEWLLEQDWTAWDRQIERDAAAGKLDRFIGEALADHAADKTGALLPVLMNSTDTGEMRMNRKLVSAAVLVSLFAFTSMAEPKKVFAPPAGSKVASGQQLDIYVVLKESKPFAATSSVLNIYETTVVVHQTRKHGRQRFKGRLEAIDADLLDPSMWQVGDFDGDGLDDYRAVAGISKNGCRTWATQTWLRDRERFTFGAKITYLTDASGKEVKSCH